jgi:hypothetical protein
MQEWMLEAPCEDLEDQSLYKAFVLSEGREPEDEQELLDWYESIMISKY